MIATYRAIPKALYVWGATVDKRVDGEPAWVALLNDRNGASQRLADFVAQHRFTRVHLFIGSVQWEWEAHYQHHRLPHADGLAATVARLREAGASVTGMFYLNDEINDLSNADRIADLVEAVHAYNQAHPEAALAGLHGDQEPDDEGVYDAYLGMHAKARERIKALKADIAYAATLKPLWLRQSYKWQGAEKPFAEHVMAIIDEATLMDYSDDAAIIHRLGDQALAMARNTSTPLEIAVEAGWRGAAPDETLWQELTGTPSGDDERDSVDGEAIVGVWSMLAEAHAHFATRSNLATYRGLCIHDYAQYVRALWNTDAQHDAELAFKVDGPPFGALRSNAGVPVHALLNEARGFVGELRGEVVVVGRSRFAMRVSKVDEGRGSAAIDAKALVGAEVTIAIGVDSAGDDGHADLHEPWIATLEPGMTVEVEVGDIDGALRIAALSRKQRRAAEREVDD